VFFNWEENRDAGVVFKIVNASTQDKPQYFEKT